MSNEFREYIATIRHLIDNHFNQEEIALLAFDLGVDFEHLAGSSKLPKIHNLILYMARRGRVGELVIACSRFRPKTTWPDVPSTEEQIGQSQQLDEQSSIQTSIHIEGNVGSGVVAGSGATVEAQNISGRDVNINKDKVQGDKVLGNKIVYMAQGEQPSLFIGVPSMPSHFFGRDELIHELIGQLTTGKGLTLAAEGLPGVGKTTLAVALAHAKDIQEHFKNGVLWASLGPQADVTSILNLWAEALTISISQSMSDQERKVAIKNAIGQRAFLLIIDDAWEIKAAELLKCGGPNCCHFVTTRSKDLAGKVASQTEVMYIPTLDKASAYALLCSMAQATCEADPTAAKELVAAVGELPLAIELLGGYLGETRRSLRPGLRQKALAEMAESAKRLQQAQLRLGSITGEKETLAETILLSLEGLQAEEGGEEAVEAFNALGAFAPKPAQFSWEAATAVCKCDEDIIAWLVERNLLEEADEQLTIHQTVSDVAQTRLETAAIDQHRNYYLEIVNNDREDWQTIQTIYGQLQWAWQNAQESETLLEFVEALEIYQKRQGLRQDSINWYKRCLAIARSKGLRKDESKFLNDLGDVYISIGQPDMALDYYNQALSILEEVGDKPGVATILDDMGRFYFKVGQRDKALDYYNQALTIREQVSDQAGLAATLSNIGLVYDRQGLTDKALDCYNQALLIQEGGSDRTGLAVTLSRIGGNYNKRNQPKEALVYCNQALNILDELGLRQEMGLTLSSIAIAYRNLGQLDLTLDYYNQALYIYKEVQDRAGEGALLSNLGMVYSDLGDFDKALNYFNQALDIHRAVVFRSFEAYTLRSIGAVYRKLKQPDKAMDYFNQALPIYEEVGEHEGERVTRWWLAQLHHANGNLREAATEMAQAVESAEFIKSPAVKQMREFLTEIEVALKEHQAH
ncbi:MAG: tetratricopeptide repeat protein [Anaerolineaceae bacterium]|nr:tetratricopeptide repeat protein [Anaerolineaceae bacterium]